MHALIIQFLCQAHRIIKIIHEAVIPFAEKGREELSYGVLERLSKPSVYDVVKDVSGVALAQEVELDPVLGRLLWVVNPDGKPAFVG